MRALVYFGKGNIRFTNHLKEPRIVAPDELVIDIAWCGICGTDLHEYTDGPIFFPEDGHTHEISHNPLPQAMGHEMAGTVLEVGPGVKNLKVGDKVVVEPTGTCRDRYRWPLSPNVDKEWCAACKKGYYNICSYLGLCGAGVQSGGFAERVVMNESHCYKVPDFVPLDVAALIQPLAVCWHAIRVCEFKAGSTALIIGAGPIGLGTILALNAAGCKDIVVSEPAKVRRELAEKMGARVYDPTAHAAKESIDYLRSIADGGDGFDYTFDCSGLEVTLNAAIQCLTFRGTAVNLAMWGHHKIQFSPMDITLHERKYTGSMCYTHHDFEAVIEALEEGRIDIDRARHMITGRVNIEDGLDGAIMKLINEKESTIKIILTPNNHGELNREADNEKKEISELSSRKDQERLRESINEAKLRHT
ncbi:BDH2 [Saccharomyces cerevisiae]|nr:Bdh2p [Saccharomyces cerevisiae YJM1133]KZV13402.1 BDH2 [Saccharomyces cerevisiae]